MHKTYLTLFHDWHHYLALRIAITGDMAWEALNIRYQLSLLGLCRSAAHSTSKRNCLTSDFPLERTEDQLLRRRRIQHIEASPVYLIARRRQRMQSVPNERGSIGGVACSCLRSGSKARDCEGEEAYQTYVSASATLRQTMSITLPSFFARQTVPLLALQPVDRLRSCSHLTQSLMPLRGPRFMSTASLSRPSR